MGFWTLFEFTVKLLGKSETVLQRIDFFFSMVINLFVGREICGSRCCIFAGKTPRTTRNAARARREVSQLREPRRRSATVHVHVTVCILFQRARCALITKGTRRICLGSTKRFENLKKHKKRFSFSFFSFFIYCDFSWNLLLLLSRRNNAIQHIRIVLDLSICNY